MSLITETIVHKRSRVLCVDGNTVYAQIGNRLCLSDDEGLSWKGMLEKFPIRIRSLSRMHARVFRRGIHSVVLLSNGDLLLVAGGALFRFNILSGDVETSMVIERGSRPMNVCRDDGGNLFWGEYFRNSGRVAVRIYASEDDARNWRVAHTFGGGAIRHVHGVFHDPHDNSIWVTTGDHDHESAIWRTDDQFRTLSRIYGGTQGVRAVQLLFTKDYIYFGTDTPHENNYICRFARNGGEVERIARVDGSVYWGCCAGGNLVFTTAVEVSKVNAGRTASIWFSDNGERWEELLGHRKDFWPNPQFQVGQIFIPPSRNDTEYIFYTPVAVEGDQTICRIKIGDR